MKNQPFTLLIHIALVVMLAGAMVTHFCGVQGTLTLRAGDSAVSHFDLKSGPGSGEFPFEVSLKRVEIIYYPATTTPMDFRSDLEIYGRLIPVAMNKVGEYGGWRFYQSGMGADSSVLTVNYDPWGVAITYIGYLLLGVGMTGFFFQKRSIWRSLLRKYRQTAAMCLMLLSVAPAMANTSAFGYDRPLPVMHRPLASNLGKVLVYWNDRICPMQTMARDITVSLYGSETYMGYRSEQVLSGWLFYFDRWQRDYFDRFPELTSVSPASSNHADKKLVEKLALVEWIGTGEIFRIFPYLTADGHIEWLSLTGHRPADMSLEQWTFMQTSMSNIKELLMEGKNIKANEEIYELKAAQRNYAAGLGLPSEAKIKAEILYNRCVRPAMAGIFSIAIGLIVLFCSIFNIHVLWLRRLSWFASALLLLYVATAMGAHWWIGGHVPLSNGPETMMFMALVALAGACLCGNPTLRGGLLIVAAAAMFVAAMGGHTPQIGALMPVLASPLLSVHVAVVIIAYALFFLIAILAAIALCVRSGEQRAGLLLLSRLLLMPAVCLLGAGIFVGAVWAYQTWGRYWGWDPKETCALVMWLVYSLPLHSNCRRLAFLRSDRALAFYLLLAFLTVIFTYFGVNYLLGGLHSYA